MVGKKRVTTAKGKRKAPAANRHGLPGVYRDMLAEALPEQADIPERPLKRRMTGRPKIAQASSPILKASQEEDEDIEFEDVLDAPAKLQQTATRSEDDSDGSDGEWDAFDFDVNADEDEPKDLELTLTSRPSTKQAITPRRRAIATNVEKSMRREIHKIHVLCLLSYLSRRNGWCNDLEVQKMLRPLLDKKMIQYLNPKPELNQFAKLNSLQTGVDLVSKMWFKKWEITERGLRRALWADDMSDVENYKLPSDGDTVFDLADFKRAAKHLEGSRDVGIQLYCALLRSAGVDVRLVCSLQPLSFNAGGPSMPKPPKARRPEGETITRTPSTTTTPDSHTSNPRRRLGHPNAADYEIPNIQPSRPQYIQSAKKPIIESSYPIFWVEVFDTGYQKWHPVDPLVTLSVSKPFKFEPPASDRENNMSYVIAFENTGCAKDVTLRYTKAFNAKTLKTRVDCTPEGKRWLRKTMRIYDRGWVSDADQIEDIELDKFQAKEAMPKNIIDFKDHPVYALERHLKRNEVLVRMQEIGKVAAGRDSKVPGGKKMESVYRRKDVRVGKSADAWYRIGREVKMGEQPIKIAPARKRPDDDEEQADVNLYSVDQTEIYIPPPVVNGRVPKNRFGNIDIYVPSMVPEGGVHIKDDEAARAARILGIDYSDALTGFEFRGRHGTAVLKGVVVASEYLEAVRAVIDGFRDCQAMEDERIRSLAALKMWKVFLRGLRIKDRVDGYKDGAEDEYSAVEDEDVQSEEGSDYGGGGFIPD